MKRIRMMASALLMSLFLAGCGAGDEGSESATNSTDEVAEEIAADQTTVEETEAELEEEVAEEAEETEDEVTDETLPNEDFTLADMNLRQSDDGKIHLIEPIVLEESDIRFDFTYTDEERADAVPFFNERINFAAEMLLKFYNDEITDDEFIWEEETPINVEDYYEWVTNLTAEANELAFYPDFNEIELAVYFDDREDETIGARSVFTIKDETGVPKGRYNINVGVDMELLYININTY